MKSTRILILLLLLGLAFLFGWKAAGRRVQIIEKSTVDTVTLYIERDAKPVDVSRPIKEVKDILPVAAPHEPASDVNPDSSTPPANSAAVLVPLSLYRFEKPGIYSITALGYQVSLPEVKTFGMHTTTIQTHVIRELPAWEIGIEVGISPRNRWIGASARYNFGRLSLQGMGGYDPTRQEFILQAQANVAIFRTFRK